MRDAVVKPSELIPEELERIKSAFLFRGESEDCVLGCLADERCTLERVSKGDVVYTPRKFRRSLGILLSGLLQVTKGELVVSRLRPGELFGAAALFTDGEDYETTLTALGPCRVVFLPQDLVSGDLAAHPRLAMNYIRYLSERIHFLNRKLDGLLAPGAAEKLTRYLLAQSGGAVECSATELARRLDVSRASLYRAFTELEERGAIVRRGKEIAVNRVLLEQNQRRDSIN
ncbi:MAG: Crp/Fnr family transcriptional regulator [Clostridia bacterium]|nr:Crp/Fnr family transcriptional regulator [Clostridia bacterium]